MAMIKVTLDGITEIEMDESELHKLEGEQDFPDAVVKYTQYHLKMNGQLVHRSVEAVIKQTAIDGLLNL